jgi:hypothetical protein
MPASTIALLVGLFLAFWYCMVQILIDGGRIADLGSKMLDIMEKEKVPTSWIFGCKISLYQKGTYFIIKKRFQTHGLDLKYPQLYADYVKTNRRQLIYGIIEIFIFLMGIKLLTSSGMLVLP